MEEYHCVNVWHLHPLYCLGSALTLTSLFLGHHIQERNTIPRNLNICGERFEQFSGRLFLNSKVYVEEDDHKSGNCFLCSADRINLEPELFNTLQKESLKNVFHQREIASPSPCCGSRKLLCQSCWAERTIEVPS